MAQLVEMGVLRFSPAGVPVIDCMLEHHSEVTEAGLLRKVHVQTKAVAMGSMAEQLGRQPLGVQAQFGGFLGSTISRSGQAVGYGRVVFHIQSFSVLALPRDK